MYTLLQSRHVNLYMALLSKLMFFKIYFDYLWIVLFTLKVTVRLYPKYFCEVSEVKSTVSKVYPHFFFIVSVCTYSLLGLILLSNVCNSSFGEQLFSAVHSIVLISSFFFKLQIEITNV